MSQMENDIFRMVSVRGPGAGTNVDPTSGMNETKVTRILREHRARADAEPSAELAASLASSPILDENALRETSLAKLAAMLGNLDQLSPAKLAALADSGEGVPAEHTLREDLSRVIDSWLVATVLQKPYSLELHESLMLTGRLWLSFVRMSDAKLARQTIESIATARLVAPRWLRTPKPPEAPPHTKGRAATIVSEKANFVRLRGELETLESLQRRAYDAYWEWRSERPTPPTAPADRAARARVMAPALDDSYFARLESRLSTGERARLGDRLGSAAAGRRPAGIGDLVGGVLDVNEIIDEANEICTRIRVFEEESHSDLPAARSPVPGADRPSVRAVGWGDLIVARERLLRYEANEIAHIENVQPGEEKRREHERILTSEDVVERETTRRTETEHDLQTTDRHELESQANSTIEEKFSVRGGVNTSGRYGLTKIDTSLDVGFERNKTEAQSDTTKLATEIVSKTVEKVFESVRELRRSTVSDRIREFNSHLLANPVANGVVPKPISGVYLWVEKLQEVALRHYGTRLMVEFHVPEPGLTLFSGANRVIVSAPKPAPLTLGPADVVPTNYLCLARAYGARDVEPPPTQFINVGYVWDSAPDEDTDGDKAEDTVAGTITIPNGYRPTAGEASVTALPEGTAANVDLYVAVGGREVVNVQDFSADAAWRFPGTDWPNGVPVSLLSHGHWDKALVLHVVLHCERTPEAFNRWQIHTWQKIRDAYDLLVQEYERAVLAAGSAASEAAAFSSRSASTNRDLERDELKKWSVKTMRAMPFEDSLFDAVVQVGEQPEIDPVTADAQAPVVRFFEESFEWREMSYFLYPYFWGRREAWQARLELDSADPQHDAFLRAGAARVIVPVTPGYEDRVLAYLDSGPSVPELERIARPIPGTIPPDTSAEDLWLDLLTQRNEDLALGSGTLSVTSGQASITINDDSRWDATERDLGRELFIGGTRYVVAEVTGPREVGLDRAFAGPTDNHASYATGSVPFGAPWVVRIPTTLIILRENVALLNA